MQSTKGLNTQEIINLSVSYTGGFVVSTYVVGYFMRTIFVNMVKNNVNIQSNLMELMQAFMIFCSFTTGLLATVLIYQLMKKINPLKDNTR